MSRLKHIVAVIVVVCAAAILWLQYSFNERLRWDNEVLRGSVAELKRVQEVREPAADESVTREQVGELSKLRSEAARLREQTNQIGALEDANQKLADSLKQLKASQTVVSTKKGPEDALPQDIHPRSSWAFRGYGTPDDTMESLQWARANGDKERFLAGLAPELRAKMEQDLNDGSFVDQASEFNMSEFRVVDREVKSDNVVRLKVSVTRTNADGDELGTSEDTFFQRIDGEWRVADSAVSPK